ncbi:MAG: hypothetical protein ACR2KX_12745 [Chitinophagaceae bacterium]
MKKFFLMAIIAGFTYFGTNAQTAPGNSAYGHSHKKAKKVKKHHYVTKTTAEQRKAINEQHKTAVKTIQQNDALTDQQQKDQIKQANVTHKDQMKSANVYRKARKK